MVNPLDYVRSSFDWARALYDALLGPWAGMHFFLRTTFVLLLLWLIIFLAAQAFMHTLGPVILYVYYNVFKRAWNYLLTESIYEWLYINRHSKGIHSPMYLRLSDKVRKNRALLHDARFFVLIKKSRRFFVRVMAVVLVAATLWVAGFGLYTEFYVPPGYAGGGIAAPAPPYAPADPEDEPPFVLIPSDTSAFEWVTGTQLVLNYQGRQGTRLRSGPGIFDHSVIEILWGDDSVIYLGSYVPDTMVPGLYWLYVHSPRGFRGYVSHQLVMQAWEVLGE